jgi:hypothetical protein
MSVERWLAALESLEQGDLDTVATLHAPIDAQARYYERLQELAIGYEKDPEKLKEQLDIVSSWQETAERLDVLLTR